LDAVARLYYWRENELFVSVPDEDWDNFLILDACRYDIFESVNTLGGELTRRYSKGAQSPIFLEKNFGDGEFHDIVYVTANPYQEKKLDDEQFHRVYHVWKSGWNQDLKTVCPETMNEVARQAHERYPNKRIIVHYMQPHIPFIGPWARENIGINTGNSHERERTLHGEFDGKPDNPYRMLRRGDLDRKTVLKGYTENLRIVLEYADELITDLGGKSIISSDHGEMFGERAWPYPWRLYQHHPPYKAEKLLAIPWLVVEKGGRRTTQSDPPQTSAKKNIDEPLEEKLEHLGYL
jgi:hypothetical protein